MTEKARTYEDYADELDEALAEIARLEREIDEVRPCNRKLEQDGKPLLH